MNVLNKCLIIGVMLMSGSITAQIQIIEVAEHANQNFKKITELPDGGFMVGSHGCTDAQPDDINVLEITEGLEFQLLNECSQVSWPETHLFCSDIHMISNDVGVMAMDQDNAGYGPSGIFKTYDGGQSWERKYTVSQSSGINGVKQLLFFNDMEGIGLVTIYNNGYNPYFIRTTDGGETWDTYLTDAFNAVDIVELSAVINGDTFYAVGGMIDSNWDPTMWKVYKFTDMGNTFEEVYSMSDNVKNPTHIQFVDENTGFVSHYTYDVNEYDYLYKTTDGGATWEELNSPAPVMSEAMKVQKINFFNEDEGLVLFGDYCNDNGCFRGGSLLRTSDGGDTWESLIFQTYSDHNFWDMVVNPEDMTGFIVGGDIHNAKGHIYRMVAPVNTEEFLNEEVEVRVAYQDGIAMLQVSGLQRASELRIYSLTGQVVHEEMVENGVYSISINEGVYIYNLKDNSLQVSGKLALQKD